MRRSKHYERLTRRFFISPRKAAELFETHIKTALRWQKHGAPLFAIRYLEITLKRDLGAIHVDWHGFHIGLNGKLYGPGKFQISAEHLKHWGSWVGGFSST